ncbi:Hypothetical protein CINCED_3A024612 [Cinara cedri]|uniref:Uncharacterized protein n=1 Tax=Cinara cedri TaxID=506608 RepID=A0A5E4NGH1_9HEMI|nr:Hypothetical protein CINCED_3A024612 [Cinara cedri]
MRTGLQRVTDEKYIKDLQIKAFRKEFINRTDRKFLYNKIKRMVEIEMKANEHLFVEERPTTAKIKC